MKYFPENRRVNKTKSSRDDKMAQQDSCIRAENEDDDGYDPYSDRLPRHEPMFQRDPWN